MGSVQSDHLSLLVFVPTHLICSRIGSAYQMLSTMDGYRSREFGPLRHCQKQMLFRSIVLRGTRQVLEENQETGAAKYLIVCPS